MTIIGPYEHVLKYICLSTDTKPTVNVAIGSEAFERDTNLLYIFDGSVWSLSNINKLSMELVSEAGVAYGVKHISNKPRVSSMPYLYDIAEGNVSNHVSLNKFGHNDTIGTSYETIWTGSSLYPYMTAADQLEIVSDDADDTSAGNGARTVRIYGLDGDWNEINETVTLNGLTQVTTTASFIRIFRAQVVTAGATGINEGTIIIRDQDTDATRAQIDPGLGQTLMATWTVPLGYSFYMTSWYAGSAISKIIDIGVWARDNTVSNASWQNKQFINFTDSVFNHKLEFPIKFTSKTDIEIRAKVSVAGGDLSAGFNGWYEI